MAKRYDPVREQYLEWLLTDKHTRRAYNAPLTKTEFAEQKGIADRTLRRWETEESFQERLKQRRAELADQAKAFFDEKTLEARPATDPRHKSKRAADRHEENMRAPVPEGMRLEAAALAEGNDPGRAEYMQVRDQIAQRAAEGDAKALELYMRYWGNHYAAAEHESDDSDLAEMDDDTLIDETLATIGVERVAWWLQQQRDEAGAEA